jgi:hypothetical protein
MTFPADQIPQAERFWSVTAYTPHTPGLQTNPDGSISIFMSANRPPGVPTANWLPIAKQPFNIMLRVYGVVEGSDIADNT